MHPSGRWYVRWGPPFRCTEKRDVPLSLQCSKGLLLALYVVAADPHNRPVFFLALFGIVIVLVALFDRAIQVGVYGAFQYGTWLYPVVSHESEGECDPDAMAPNSHAISPRADQHGSARAILCVLSPLDLAPLRSSLLLRRSAWQ